MANQTPPDYPEDQRNTEKYPIDKARDNARKYSEF